MTFDKAEQLIRSVLIEPVTFEDVLAKLKSGEATAHEAENTLTITEIRDLPEGRECFAWLNAGEMKEMRDVLRPQVEDWARANGCDWFEVHTRRAAGRILSKLGYTETPIDEKRSMFRKMLNG